MEENLIYDDLVSQGDLGDIIHNLEKRKNDLELHVASLEEDVKKLCDKIREMKAVQDNLSRNISELFKTAKSELNRKDRRIAELQAQLDDIVFRRNPTQFQVANKRKRDDSNFEERNKKSKNENVEIVATKNLSSNHDINTRSEKSAYKDDKRINERVNPNSNSHDSSRHENDRGRKILPRDDNCKRERCTQKEGDSHRSVLDRVYPDQNPQLGYDHSGKTRENNNRRDRNDEHRDKRDSYKDKHSNIESRMDNRLSRRDHRDLSKEHYNKDYRNTNKDHRDRSRDYRTSIKDHRDGNREYKDHRRDRKESRPENTKGTLDDRRNEPIDSDPKKEPVFSAAESSLSASECCMDKEEGELSDDDGNIVKNQNRQEHPAIGKSKMQREKAYIKGPNKEMERNRGKRIEVQKMDYVEANKRLKNASDNKICSAKNVMQNKKLLEEKPNICPDEHKKSNRQNSGICTERGSSKNEESKHEDDKIYPNKNNEENKELKDEIRKPPTEENLAENAQPNTEETKCDNEKNNVNVNIISQVILNEGMKEALARTSNIKPVEQIKSQENKNKHSIITLDRSKRESRVPRNLTDELNINLERSEKKQKLMNQIFGSSEKRGSFKPFDQFSPTHSIGLSHEGEIPNLQTLPSPNPREIKSDHHTSNATNSANPVTEFQIFKTNLPSLEKSNSLPSIAVQIQTPDNSTRSKEETEKSLEKSPVIVDKIQTPVKQNEISTKLISEQVQLSIQTITANVAQSSSDVCDVSFDLLNMDIGQCKVEDFPNLIGLTESKDISDLLLTPKDTTAKITIRRKNINSPLLKKLQYEVKLNNPDMERANQKELGEHSDYSDEKKMEHKEKLIPGNNTLKVPNKSSNIINNKKKRQVTNKIEKPKGEIVSNKNISKSPKKYINEKKIKTNSKIIDNMIANEKILDTPQEQKNEGLKLQANNETVTQDSKDMSKKDMNSAKESTNTSSSQRQNRTNGNKKPIDECGTDLPEKSVSTSNQIVIVNSLNETKSMDNSDKRRKRCGVKWV